jgi:H+/gluconate symporter-like permease
MIGIFGICLSLALLMFLAYRGINVLVLAPVMALLAVLFSGDVPLFATYTQVFMTAAGKYMAACPCSWWRSRSSRSPWPCSARPKCRSG